MAKFNAKAKERTLTENLAGGEAFSESPELELVSILLTSFVQDQFYSKANETIIRVKALLSSVDPRFAAQAAIYARKTFGMRSISHVVAGELCHRVSKQPWMKDFLNAVVLRPDDILEITSYYDTRANKVTHAMRKGLGKAMSRFGEYALAKYRGEGKAISMVDCANIYHPKNTPALQKLIKGELKNTDTWEAKLTESGKGETEEAKLELKADAWRSLLEEKKLGYFALLRNLRNIAEQAPKSLELACQQLVDPEAIKKSLVLPFRFMTALEEIEKLPAHQSMPIVIALSNAIEIAMSNCPELPGRTLVAIDDSGSMKGQPFNIASLFAAVLIKRCHADLIMFNTEARYLTLNPMDSAAGICGRLSKEFGGGGTDFKPIFGRMIHSSQVYDRIIILSDMQAWVHYDSPAKAFALYKQVTGAKPHVYSFDLAGHGTMQFPEKQVYALAGFSEKVFDIMKLLEEDRNALVNEIKKVTF